MDTDQELIIPLSKTKMILTLLGSIAFVVLGGWLLIYASNGAEFIPFFVQAVGVSAIVFFGIVAIFASKKLFDKSPGLIINAKGIFDNSSGVSVGLITWDQITGFSVSTVESQRFLTIHVHNPEAYLNRGNFLQRIAIKANSKFYGSPVQLSSNSLQTNFDELLKTIQQYHERYRND